MLNRRCFCCDIDPVLCEITIRRLEHFRTTGKTGWQNGSPFFGEISRDSELAGLVKTLTPAGDKEADHDQFSLALAEQVD